MKSLLCSIGVLVCATVVLATDIDVVLKRLEDIENREKGYVSVISELKQKLGDQDDRIRQLENQLSDKDAIILKLDNRVADLCHDIETIKERIDNVASEEEPCSETDDKKDDRSERNYIVKTDDSTQRVAEKTDLSLREDLQKARSAMKKRFVLDSETPVAFHAVLDGSEIPHLGINQPIVFGTELLNLGGAYHKQHGIFIAPMKGVYVFSASIMSYVGSHSEFRAALVKNGTVLAMIFGHGDNGRHDQGSVTVTVQLEAADEIWVKNTAFADESIYGGRYDSFTGFLLAPL